VNVKVLLMKINKNILEILIIGTKIIPIHAEREIINFALEIIWLRFKEGN
jgi:hypothetical protein